MIDRYARAPMQAIWADGAKFQIWLDIETLAMEAMAQYGHIPPSAAAAVREKGRYDIARIHAIEAEVKHDVIAFLTNVAEHVGPDARYMHQGMTSSDVLDTCFNVQLVRAGRLLLQWVARLLTALRSRADEHATTITIGRSHGIHAEPTTFGIKLAGHYAEFARNHRRLRRAIDEVATCAISGAVGTFANVDPRVEDYVAQKLGLRPEPHSTQIVPRDRHAAYFQCLALIAAAIERLATEIRHLQRSELREVEESFGDKQKGSSAMPHKRNPVLSENLCGLARLVRAAVTPALENITLWHERDISHSSVERVIGPDTTVTLDFALHRCAGMIETLVINADAMAQNLQNLQGLHNSQRVMLALVKAGMVREDAYAIVQASAMRAWHERRPLIDLLRADGNVTAMLDHASMAELFDDSYHTRNAALIITRAYGEWDEASLGTLSTTDHAP